MEIHVFAESSNTTGDPKSPLEEYYQGLFGMVAGLTEELSAFGDTELHVLSERYGIATSDRMFSDLEVEHPEPVGLTRW